MNQKRFFIVFFIVSSPFIDTAAFPSYSQSNLGAQAVLQAEAKHIDLQVPLMVGASKRKTSRNIS